MHWGPGGCQATLQVGIPDINTQRMIEQLPYGPGPRFLDLTRLSPHIGDRDSAINRLTKTIDSLKAKLTEEETKHEQEMQ